MALSAQCRTCGRPPRRCICAFSRNIPCDIEVVIVQHPDERKNAKNTGSLTARCLGAKVLSSENEDFDATEVLVDDGTPQALLFPDHAQFPSATSHTNVERIWLLDATWRKALKLMHTHPHLHRLARISINAHSSSWRIRKPQKAGQLASIEAISCYFDSVGKSSSAEQLQIVFEEFQKSAELYRPKTPRT